MSSQRVFEGVKFGDKEKQLVMQNSSDFNVGIEYEFNTEHNESKTIDDIIDFRQDVDDYLRDIRNAMDEHDLDSDEIYNEIVIEVLYVNDIADNEGYVLYELYRLFGEVSKVLTDVNPSDTKTDDMFSSEKETAMFELFVETANQSDIDIEEITELLKRSHDLEIHDFALLMRILDLYFTGEFIHGSSDKISDFFDLYNICVQNPDVFSVSEEDLVDGNYSQSDVSFVSELFKQLMSGTLNDAFLNTDNSYDLSGHGFSAGDFDVQEYIDYVEDIENIAHITDAMVSDFSQRVNDGEFEHDMRDEVVSNVRNTVRHIDRIEDEHDDMVEVITDLMTLEQSVQNIKDMFDFINNNGQTYDYAGMHISISTNKYDLSDFNIMKFVTLMHIPYILEYFPERGHVADLQEIVEKAFSQYVVNDIVGSVSGNEGMVEFIKRLITRVESKINNEKFQSIKFGDYAQLDGRIELRFFGGENYQDEYEKVMNQLLRSLYLMNIAYTDVHDKDYYKQVVKVINKSLADITDFSFSKLYKSLSDIDRVQPIFDSFNYYFDNQELSDEIISLWKKHFSNDYIDVFKRFYNSWIR